MRVTFVSSPFRAETVEQKIRYERYVRDACRDCITRGEVPIAPHLYLPKLLDDADELDRELALEMCRSLIDRVNCVAFYGDYGVSEGMNEEYEHANRKSCRATVRWRFLGGRR